jgi:hypothetical protein
VRGVKMDDILKPVLIFLVLIANILTAIFTKDPIYSYAATFGAGYALKWLIQEMA